MNKKSLGALLLSAALLIGGTASTYAYFTNEAKTGIVQFTTGNVKVDFVASQESNWSLINTIPGRDNDEINVTNKVTATSVAPGDNLKKTFVLKNTGLLDAKVKLSLDNITPAGLPNGSGVDVTGWCWSPDFKAWQAYTIDADGNNRKDVDLKITYAADNRCGYVELNATPGETMHVDVYVKVDPLMPNGTLTAAAARDDGSIGPNNAANFEKTFGFRVKAEATQWNNLGWNQDGTGR
jgi:predicted ribosomally synthesized peptide with SipW-like signal peptide